MKNLVCAELYSFFKRKSVILFLLGTIILGLFGILYVTKLIENPLSLDQYFTFIYSHFYIVSMVLITFLALLVFHDEYENKTMKNNIFQGFSIMKILISKYIVSIFIECIFLFILTIFIILGGIELGANKGATLSFIKIVVMIIPTFFVYTFLIESCLFATKKVLIGLILAYVIDQIVKLSLILVVATGNSTLIFLLQQTPVFVFQNLRVDNFSIYLTISCILWEILYLIVSSILKRMELTGL